MIKKREISKPNSPDMDSFINGADEQKVTKLDPKAPRKFKTHTIPMNEHEYQLIRQRLQVLLPSALFTQVQFL